MQAAAAALRQGTVDERFVAARVLGDFSEAVPVLRAALDSEADANVRAAIFTSLARLDTAPSFAAILEFLRGDDAAARTAARDALMLMPARIEAGLAQLLRDPDPDVAVLACDFARAIDPQAAAAIVGEFLEDARDVNVVAAAVEVLAEAGSVAHLPVLARCAARFDRETFLVFAIGIASSRILARAK